MIETQRHVCLALLGLGVLLFADAPLRTFGQRYRVQRSRERISLLSLELDLVALWAIAVFCLLRTVGYSRA